MVKEVSDQNFDKEVLECSTVPVLVDFWAPWCGPCRMVAPVVKEMAKKFEGKLKVVKINTDENQSIAAKYAITGIPSLLMFKEGKEINRFVGFRQPQVLEEDIKKVL